MLASTDTLPLARAEVVLRHHRDALTEAHVAALGDHVRFKENRVDMNLQRFAASECVAAIDYLLRYCSTGDLVWRDLYLGHLLEQVHAPEQSKAQALQVRSAALTALRAEVLDRAPGALDPSGRAALDAFMASLITIAVERLRDAKQIRVLFVGDCFYENMHAFLAVPLLESGLVVQQELISSRNPVEVKAALRRAAARPFHLVCFSPYTNESSVPLLEVFFQPNPFLPRAHLEKLAAQAHSQTASMLGFIAETFPCPIAVQNTRNIRRHDGSPASVAKNLLTRRPRTLLAAQVNGRLEELVATLGAERDRPIMLVDETAVTAGRGELHLGRLFYDGDEYHPSVLEREMGPSYRAVVMVAGLLMTKKLVVLDLDDTLWEGTIGEGEVRHYLDRQQALLELKRKGILLAVVSKNDPDKVHWRDGLLQPSDLVAAEISWDPKPVAIRRIAAELNLKPKDFVFIDDRPDQRELVGSSIPEIDVLDATSAMTWDALRAWLALIPEQDGGDRTRLYHERRQRASYLDTQGDDEFDQAAMFALLELKLTIGIARPEDLARATELINRTNQFNVAGSRTTKAEVKGWSDSDDHVLLLGEARDRFGEMGIVSVLVLHREGGALSIVAWVLSCRVFGYGIETAMMNATRELARRSGLPTISGHLVETPHNQPCRDVFARNGFDPVDGAWWIAASGSSMPDPSWLGVALAEPLAALRIAPEPAQGEAC